MSCKVVLQNTINDNSVPDRSLLENWANTVLTEQNNQAELCIRIVSEAESAQLNGQYRQQHKSTNILSFPYDLPEAVQAAEPLLGDLVICASVVAKEAHAQHKTLNAHWAHLVVHGILHLLGYEHQQEQEAQIMESKEIAILQHLGYPNPYAETNDE